MSNGPRSAAAMSHARNCARSNPQAAGVFAGDEQRGDAHVGTHARSVRQLAEQRQQDGAAAGTEVGNAQRAVCAGQQHRSRPAQPRPRFRSPAGAPAYWHRRATPGSRIPSSRRCARLAHTPADARPARRSRLPRRGQAAGHRRQQARHDQDRAHRRQGYAHRVPPESMPRARNFFAHSRRTAAIVRAPTSISAAAGIKPSPRPRAAPPDVRQPARRRSRPAPRLPSPAAAYRASD